MIRVTYPTYDDHGSFAGESEVGYFRNEKVARKELRGLCPWDFNTMWGGSDYNEFRFTEVPGTLTRKDIRLLKEQLALIFKAQQHAGAWVGSWHYRAPENW
jgi:hypothetical protein